VGRAKLEREDGERCVTARFYSLGPTFEGLGLLVTFERRRLLSFPGGVFFCERAPGALLELHFCRAV
jgi:hypothetical protein